MRTNHRFALNKRLRELPAWKLLAAIDAPEILGILHTHLYETDRRMSENILVERIARDKEILAAEGHQLSQTSPKHYLWDWTNSGYLVRTTDPDTLEVVYELSAGAIQAIRFIESLSQKKTTATESRLSIIIDQISKLAVASDPNPETRAKNLVKKREMLDAEIAAVQMNQRDPLSKELCLEAVGQILILAEEMTDEFRQVKDEFEKLNLQLREQIVESEGTRGKVLDDLFAGIDVLQESPAGRTFRSFFRLLTNPKQSNELEEAIEIILREREFSKDLQPVARRFLAGFKKILLDRSKNVHKEMQYFSNSLRQFVESREYLEQKKINELLTQVQKSALDLKAHIKLTDLIGRELFLTSSDISSVSQMRLRDPSTDIVCAEMVDGRPVTISIDAIGEQVFNSEIDFDALMGNIQNTHRTRDQVSISHILSVYPAQQGLGSVIGYISLGAKHGVVSSQEKELIRWESMEGSKYVAYIPSIYFLKGCFDEVSQKSQ